MLNDPVKASRAASLISVLFIWCSAAIAQCGDPPFTPETWRSLCRKYGGYISNDGRECLGWNRNWCNDESTKLIDRSKIVHDLKPVPPEPDPESDSQGSNRGGIVHDLKPVASDPDPESNKSSSRGDSIVHDLKPVPPYQETKERAAAERAGFAPAVEGIPVECFVAEELRSNAMCDVIGAAEMGWNLADASSRQNVKRLIMQILAEKAANKLVVLSLEPSLSLGSRIGLVRSIHAAIVGQLRDLSQRIQAAMMDDPVKAQWLKAQAHLDAYEVTHLRQRVSDEQALAVSRAAAQLRACPLCKGIMLECGRSCLQIVSAARGVNIFDHTSP